MKRSLTLSLALMLSLAFLFTGCQTSNRIANKMGIRSNSPKPTNFYLNEEKIYGVQRVVMMPVHAPETGLASEKNLDEQFRAKLTATQLFEVVSISREHLVRRFGQRSFSSAVPLNDSLFQYLKQATNADAVVFFDITAYQPFRPIKVGVRGKMINLPKKEILWAVDEIYDSADQHTSRAAVKYEKKYLTKIDTTKRYDSILVSPTRFIAYAAEKSILSLPENSLSNKF